jgi:hypothetical protein
MDEIVHCNDVDPGRMVLLASDTSVNMSPEPLTPARRVAPGWKNSTSIACVPTRNEQGSALDVMSRWSPG